MAIQPKHCREMASPAAVLHLGSCRHCAHWYGRARVFHICLWPVDLHAAPSADFSWLHCNKTSDRAHSLLSCLGCVVVFIRNVPKPDNLAAAALISLAGVLLV